MSLLVVWPIGKEAQATTYVAFAAAHNPDLSPGALWDYDPPRVDTFGQRVVPYLGPGGFLWNSLPFPEPEGGPAERSDAVLSSSVQWPEEE